MLRPSNSIVPALGSSAARISLEVVVLPQPDSPTRPSVSPALMVKLMPSTAFTQPRTLPSRRPPTGKCFLRSRTSSNGSLTCYLFACQPAFGGSAILCGLLIWFLATAALERMLAAGMEATTGGQVRQIRRLAGNAVERLLRAELRYGVEQRPGVRVPRIIEEAPHRLDLNDLTSIHHRHLVTHLCNNTQVVRYEDERDTTGTLEVLQQVQVLELDRHVEVGGGLIGDDDLGTSGLGHGPDNPLAHAAAHLVGEFFHSRFGRRNAHCRQQLLHSVT